MSSVAEIRSWFEVPAIAHYCYLFRAAFDLTEFEIEDLEESLLIDGADEGHEASFIPDLLARLLRGLYRTKDITSKTYERYLNDLLDYHYTFLESKENPVKDSEFRKLPCRTKVTILYDVCHWRLEVDDVQELLKGREADELRVQPIGSNSNGDTYWYFYGTRLYKEKLIEKDNSLLNGCASHSNGRSKRKKNVGKLANSRKRTRNRKDSSDDLWSESDESLSLESQGSNDDRVAFYQHGSADATSVLSLECSTVDEWQSLIESLKDSKNNNERLLYSILADNYMENIAYMIEAKEKAAKKKILLDAIPRRASDRIALKANLKEEEERLRQLEEEARAIEAEERRKEMDEKKKMERENRLRERERVAEERRLERERRVKHREEQKWALENPELATQYKEALKVSENENQEQKKRRLSGQERDEDEYTSMYKVINALKKHKDAWPFLEPVEESYAPQYYDIITDPMDIVTIEGKLDRSEYTYKEQMTEDIKLMISNCLKYNGPDSPYTKMAHNLERAYAKLFNKEFPADEDASDEDYINEDENPRKRKRNRNERSLEKVAKFNENKSGSIDSESSRTKSDSQNKPKQLIEIAPNNIFQRIPNGVPFGPPNMIRLGHTTVPAEVLRAQLMLQQQQQQQQQQQIRQSGLQQLINTMNGPIGNQMSAFGPRIAFMNRPGMRPGMPSPAVSSAAFFNALIRPTATSNNAVNPNMQASAGIPGSMNQAFSMQPMLRSPFVSNGNIINSSPSQLQQQQQMLAKQQQLIQQTAQLQQLQQRIQIQQQLKTLSPTWPMTKEQTSNTGQITISNATVSSALSNPTQPIVSVVTEKPLPLPSHTKEKSTNETANQKSQEAGKNHVTPDAEDPMSEANRNKKISLEESNQRVRNWLNSQTSYFGPLDEEHSDAKSGGKAVSFDKTKQVMSQQSSVPVNKSSPETTKATSASVSNNHQPTAQPNSLPFAGPRSQVTSLPYQQMPALSSLGPAYPAFLQQYRSSVGTLNLGRTKTDTAIADVKRNPESSTVQNPNDTKGNQQLNNNKNIGVRNAIASTNFTGATNNPFNLALNQNQKVFEENLAKSTLNKPGFLIENLFSSGLPMSSGSEAHVSSTSNKSLNGSGVSLPNAEQLQRNVSSQQGKQQQVMNQFINNKEVQQEQQNLNNKSSPSRTNVLSPEFSIKQAIELKSQSSKNLDGKEPQGSNKTNRSKIQSPDTRFPQTSQRQGLVSQSFPFLVQTSSFPVPNSSTYLQNGAESNLKTNGNLQGQNQIPNMPPLRVSPSIPQLGLPFRSMFPNQQQTRLPVLQGQSRGIFTNSSPGLKRTPSDPPIAPAGTSTTNTASSSIRLDNNVASANSGHPHRLQQEQFTAEMKQIILGQQRFMQGNSFRPHPGVIPSPLRQGQNTTNASDR